MVLKIAITGNIASGKSQVEKKLEKLGYVVYDSDIIAHEVLDTVSGFYGYDVLSNGKIDRNKLGKLVFSNDDLKKKLVEIIHPKVKTKILELFEQHKSDKYIFISVPLLYEAGFDDMFDKVVFVSVDKDIQLRRLMQRNNYTKDEAQKRILSQMAQAEKINKADYVIENNSSLENLSKQIKCIIDNL